MKVPSAPFRPFLTRQVRRCRSLLLSLRAPVIAPELQSAINECNTLTQLMDLLFALDYREEAILNAFYKRIDDLEYASY